MEWIEHLNGALNYIEEHLDDSFDITEAARIACCSSYHFQRVFSYVAGIPLSEYIRRRRMSVAAVELQNGSKVLDVALKYGYDSPTAFNRAFQGVHGVTPSQAKKHGAVLTVFPPISIHITIKGDVAMNYRIENRDAFCIVGVSKPLFKEIEKNFQIVPEMWREVAEDGTIAVLSSMIGAEPAGVLGVSVCSEPEQWRYYIAVASAETVESPLEAYTIPAATWAIFPGKGPMPGAIQELEKRIVTEWLPASGYEYANAPDIEVYLNADPQNAKFEVWIPVTKKSL